MLFNKFGSKLFEVPKKTIPRSNISVHQMRLPDIDAQRALEEDVVARILTTTSEEVQRVGLQRK